MGPMIDVTLFESVTTGLAWLGAIGVVGTFAVVALVVDGVRPRPRPRATITLRVRRIADAA